MLRKPPCLKEVAEKAGCSISSVSIVLNNSKGNIGVGDALRATIQETAETLGYRANYHARTLQTGRALTFGLVLPSKMTGGYFGMELEAGVQKRASEFEYDVLVFGKKDPRRALKGLEERQVDGLILCMPGRCSSIKLKKHWPIVFVQQAPGNGYPSVSLDPAPGLRKAVEHLADLGHETVMYLGLKQEDREKSPERRALFLRAAHEAGLRTEERFISRPKDFNLNVGKQLEWYRKEIEEKLVCPDNVTAIMCYNDFCALALYPVLQQRGIRIPADMSVIGFDNFFAGFSFPALTTVSHMLDRIGEKAVDLLVNVIQEGREHPYNAGVRVPAELIRNESTARKKYE